MKSRLAIVFLIWWTLVRCFGGELSVTTNAAFCRFNTSYFTLNCAGCYEDSGRYLYWPKLNIHCYEDSRSGGSIQEANENRLERRGLAEWANGSNWWGEIWVDNNGGYTTEGQVYTQLTNTFSSPGLLFNGTAYTNEGGWVAAHAGQIKWICGGDIPISGHYLSGSDGDIRNTAITNIATAYGYTNFDMYHYLDDYAGWSNDIETGANLRQSVDGEHPGPSGALGMAIRANQSTMDTNVNTAIIDWTAAAVALTNHCVVSGVSLIENTLGFTWHADRHSMAWDCPDGTITNDAGNAFIMQPGFSNAFCEILRFTNAPPNATFNFFEDGSNILTATSAQLTNGVNLFPVTKGALWAQRKEVLGRIRDKRGTDRVTLVNFTDSGGTGEIKYSDGAGQTLWDEGERGDTLISGMAPWITVLNGLDALIWTAATPTNHVFTITVVGQTITFPSPGDQTYGVAPITLNATASSGLTVTYTVTSGPGTVSGNLLTITNVGQVTIQASQPGNSTWPPATPVSQTINIAQKTLTPSITVADKIYDGTPIGTITHQSLIGVVGTDMVSLTAGPAAFSNKNVGTAKTVTVTGLSLTGPDVGKYTLASASATTTANISALVLTVTGVTAADKVYNGNTSATVNTNGAALVGIIGSDVVILSGTATGAFTDPNVAAGKTVTISGLILSGTDAGNYQLTQPTATASISRASTLIAIASSANPSSPTSNVTFTATVNVVSPGGGVPMGNLIFMDGATALITNTLTGAMTIFSTAALSHSSHTVAARYCGNGNFFGSANSLNQVVDTPPIAGPLTLPRYATEGVKIRITELRTNDSDPDGDAFSLISIAAVSASGGTVSTQGVWICYQPPVGFTNSDSFSRVIADSIGLQATGTVSIAVQTDTNALDNLAPPPTGTIGNHLPTLQFLGIPQRVYTIQYTTNLNAPDWQTLGTATADDTGLIQFFDSPPPNSPPRFYRTTYP